MRRRCSGSVWKPLWWALIGLWLAAPFAAAFVRSRFSNGPFWRRADFTNIRFLINDQTAPGLTNSSGAVIITSDSDPRRALQEAMSAWTNVASSNAAFAAPQQTPDESASNNGQHLVSFVDTSANRSLVGDALAVTRTFLSSTGEMTDTDIVFSPTTTFSTTLQAGTFDIFSVAAHELGHALGASHTGLLSATMFARTRSASNLQGVLTADDIAFVTDAYPEPAAAASLGAISGRVSLSGGGPVAGALVAAVDSSTGVVIGNISLPDGAYTIPRIPAGRYQIYVEPMDGPAVPADFRNTGVSFDTNFSTTFFATTNGPAAVTVSAGRTATADLTVDEGAPALDIEGGGAGRPGGSRPPLSFSSFLMRGGETLDVVLFGRGLEDATLSEDSISFLGAPISVQRGSLRRTTVVRGSGETRPALSFTVDVAPSAPVGVATAVIRSASATAVYSGGIRILEPVPSFSASGVVSAASFAGGSVAPGEIITVFGSNLGPMAGVGGQMDLSLGRLSTRVAGVSVTFNGEPAPLFFVRQDQINAQAPFEIAGASLASVVVTYQHNTSNTITIPVAGARPGIFMRPGGGSQGIVLNPDGTLNEARNPATRGSVVVLFGTGQGAIQPPLATGQLAPLTPLSQTAQMVTAAIGDREAQVLFAGMTPTFAGLLQVNLEVPPDAPAGPAVPFTLSVGGVSSQPNVTMAIR